MRWILSVSLLIVHCFACGGGERPVAGRYVLDSRLMARAVAAALGYGPDAATDVEQAPEEEAKYTVRLVLNTAVMLTVDEDGTFTMMEVIRKEDESVQHHKKGSWRFAEAGKLEFTTTEIDGKPVSTTQIADYSGERIVFWESMNGVEINAVFVRRRQ